MSKAFTKEGDDEDLDLDSDVDDSDLTDDMASTTGGKVYMTIRGAQKMRDELQHLRYVERPKVVDTVAWAASNGDRSENADYIYGKRRLREIDRRIRFLTKRLDNAEVVDPAKQNSQRVLFGATVTVLKDDKEEKTYTIVGVDETDAKSGCISWLSPIGKSLLQARVGDVVVLQTPKGEVELEILKIQYLTQNE